MIVFTTAGILLTSWPSLLLVHCSRYLYLPVFFFTIFIGLLASAFSRIVRYLIALIALIYAIIQCNVTAHSLTRWVQETHYENTVIKNLAATSRDHQKITLVGYPVRLLGAGTVPGIHLYEAHATVNLHLLFPYVHRWEDGPTKFPSITVLSDSVKIESLSPSTVWFQPYSWPLEPLHGFSEILRSKDSKIFACTFSPSPTIRECAFILTHEQGTVHLERVTFNA